MQFREVSGVGERARGEVPAIRSGTRLAQGRFGGAARRFPASPIMNNRTSIMASHTANITAAALLLTSSALAWATNDFVEGSLVQETTQPRNDKDKYDDKAYARSTTQYVTVEKLEGSDCRLQPPADKPGEKDEGEIKDILIDSKSGELRWAVLSSDGREVLVPAESMKWDAQGQCFVVDRTEADLKRLPEFDLDDAGKSGLDGAVVNAEKGWRDLRGNDGTPRDIDGTDGAMDKRPQEASSAKTIEGTSYYAIPSAYFRTSELDELELYGPKDEIGGITRAIVNCDEKKVEFLVVNSGGVLGVAGEKYLLPFEAARICKDRSNEDAEPRLYANMTKEQLEASVRYEEPKDGVLDAATAERARSMHKNRN
jgi:hypothetical protein